MIKKGIANYINSPCEPEVIEMLQHSNWIENERSEQALQDAIEAWKYAIRNNSQGMTTKYILKIHNLMQRNIKPRIAGKFRQCDVWIGGDKRSFISDELMLASVKGFINIFLNSLKDKQAKTREKEQVAKETHVMFEMIHPFEDGNGRVGRILYNIHRLRLGLPIHIIHEGAEQREYYLWFR